MARKEITTEYGQIKLDGKLVPGIYRGMNISGAVRIKEEEAQGKSGKYKQATGYEDLSMQLALTLENDLESDPYEKLQTVVAFFRKTDKNAKPQVYTITNPHAAAWGLKKVLLKDLKSDDPPDADYIRVSLEFVEWESPMVSVEARAVQGPLKDRGASIPANANDEVEKWQKKPDDGTYSDEVVVPDDD